MMKQIRLLMADRLLLWAMLVGEKYWSNDVLVAYAKLINTLLEETKRDHKAANGDVS